MCGTVEPAQHLNTFNTFCRRPLGALAHACTAQVYKKVLKVFAIYATEAPATVCNSTPLRKKVLKGVERC